MSEFINTAEVLGDEAVVTKIIDRTITEYKENRVTSIGQAALSYCQSLTTVDLPNVTSIGTTAFVGCSALTTVILRSETVCTAVNANILNNTPIKSGTGYVYVPDDLVDSYKAATNWSTYANQIKPISELGE